MKKRQQIVASACLIMRISITQIALTILTVSSLSANDANGQNVLERKLTLNIKNQPLKKVIGTIQDQTKVSFSYSNNIIEVNKLFSYTANNQTLESFLNKFSGDNNITYQIIDNNIVLFKSDTDYSSPSNFDNNTQQQSVKGKVIDSEGNPISEVSVLVKGSSRTTTTNAQGNFEINVPGGNSVLILSYVGYITKEIPTSEAENKSIVLSKSVIELDNVVVTAMGIKRESRSLGYATQQVKGSEVKSVKGLDLGTSLTGKVSGLIVKNSPEFAQAPELTLRGEIPLLVIDGVPYGNMSLRDIPQDDIASIDFLKGATASALYGERGGAGAIMVTTIKGAVKNGLSISLNSSNMFTAGYLAIPKMQSVYGRVVNTATNTYVRSGDGAWGPALEGQEVIQWDPISKEMKPMPFIPRGANNFKNFLETGHILNNNLSIANRGEYGGIRLSSTWVNSKGTYPNSKFDKITYSVGGDLKFDKVDINTSLSYNKHQSPNLGFGGYTGYDPMYSMLIWGSPDWDVLDYKSYWLIPNEQQNSSFTSGNNNPFFDRYERIRPYNKDVFNGQITINYELSNKIKATIRTGYDTYSDKQVVRISQGSYQGGGNAKVMNVNGTEIWGENLKGSFNSGLSRGFSTNTEALVFGKYDLNDFSFDGFIGGSIYYKEDEGIEARTQGGLSVPGYYSLKASINPAAVASSIRKKQTNSVFSKVGANWRNMMYLEATLRNDWSSTLSKENRSYLYPSFSGSFVLSEILPKYDWLSFWKFRSNITVAKGTPDIYDINNVYSVATNQWAGLPTATYPTSIRPSDVYSFSTKSTEFGTDLSLFNNRVSVDVTYFKKRYADLLRLAPVTESSGFNNVYTNTKDETERRGWELTLNFMPIKNENIQWDIGVNWTKFASYYVKIDPLYAVQGRKWVKEGERTDHYLYNEHQTNSEGKLVINNGAPIYNPFLSLAGYSDPDWVWGINTKARYKSFTLGLSFDGRVGGLAQSVTEMYMWRSGNHPNSITDERYLDMKNPGTKNYLAEGVKVVSGSVAFDVNGEVLSDNRVFAPNDVKTTYKAYLEAIHKGTAWGGSPSPADLYSTTFFKLREAYLTYHFSSENLKKLPFKGASVSFVGQNLLYWAKQFKYSDIDGGTENFADPSLRYIGFNIKLDF